MAGRIGRGGWFALGTLGGVAMAAAAVTLWTVAPVACNAMAYLDSSPIRLVLPTGTSSVAAVSACFDLECTPSPVAADSEGEFLVPQAEPYLNLSVNPVIDVAATGIYVTVTENGAVVADNRFGIETISDAPAWSRCPGPFHYGPVIVG